MFAALPAGRIVTSAAAFWGFGMYNGCFVCVRPAVGVRGYACVEMSNSEDECIDFKSAAATRVHGRWCRAVGGTREYRKSSFRREVSRREVEMVRES